MALQNQGKFAEAETLVRDTLAIQQRVLGDEEHLTLHTAGTLTVLLTNTDQDAAAEELGRHILAQAQRTLGPDHPTSLHIAFTLATALCNQGQTAEAVALLTATLATQQRVLGPGHPATQNTARWYGMAQKLWIEQTQNQERWVATVSDVGCRSFDQ